MDSAKARRMDPGGGKIELDNQPKSNVPSAAKGLGPAIDALPVMRRRLDTSSW